MKYLIPFLLFAATGTVYAFYIEETQNGLVLETPDNKVYHFDQVGDKLQTYGIDGTCYWYDGNEFSNCTDQEKNNALALISGATSNEGYTISKSGNNLYLNTNLRVYLNGTEIRQ